MALILQKLFCLEITKEYEIMKHFEAFYVYRKSDNNLMYYYPVQQIHDVTVRDDGTALVYLYAGREEL
jgi:hypothetical protein